jgi:hypothetical protein
MDQLFEDLDGLRDLDRIERRDIASTFVLSGLPARLADKYDVRFTRQFLVITADLTGALIRGWTRPACVTQELALRCLFARSKSSRTCTTSIWQKVGRYGLARLSWLDRATGRVVRRYEHDSPGDLVHVDIKKLGRIPDGGGHRSLGRAAGNRNKTGTAPNRRPGYAFLHNAVDDHSRLAYTEILTDEKKETAAGFWERANAYFESCGVVVKRVLTDNGSCYRSYAFKDALGPDIKHKRTRPYGPRPTAKSSATTAPCSMNGPTPNPTHQKPSVLPHSQTGSIITIITEATPHSKVSHRPAASLTSQVNTARKPGILPKSATFSNAVTQIPSSYPAVA